MPARFTDAEIAAYIAERKVLPLGYQDMFKLKAKRGHDECEFDVRGPSRLFVHSGPHT